jgi:hypothetical protein
VEERITPPTNSGSDGILSPFFNLVRVKTQLKPLGCQAISGKWRESPQESCSLAANTDGLGVGDGGLEFGQRRAVLVGADHERVVVAIRNWSG